MHRRFAQLGPKRKTQKFSSEVVVLAIARRAIHGFSVQETSLRTLPDEAACVEGSSVCSEISDFGQGARHTRTHARTHPR